MGATVQAPTSASIRTSATGYGAPVRSRAWITGGIVVMALGFAVVLLTYPLTPRSDPAPVQVFGGSSDEPDVILVKEPGSYAIWQLGRTGSDRCRVSTR